MSLLNSLLGSAMKTVLNNSPQTVEQVSTLMSSLFQQVGGLSGLVQKFKQNGLEEIITSWMSDQESIKASAQQIEQAVGQEVIQNLAQSSGLNKELFDTLLAKGLPKIVGLLSNNGKIAPEDAPELSLETAQKLVQKIFS